jgi:hypothetical protein
MIYIFVQQEHAAFLADTRSALDASEPNQHTLYIPWHVKHCNLPVASPLTFI